MNCILSRSTDAPIRLVWSSIVDLEWFTRFHTFPRNLSLPISLLLIHFSASWRSTTTCVEIPAWSVPGTRRVSYPCIRWYLTIVSSTANISACHRCRYQVTFGGGIDMVNCSFGFLHVNFFTVSGEKYPASSRCLYIVASKLGSYFFGNSDIFFSLYRIKGLFKLYYFHSSVSRYPSMVYLYITYSLRHNILIKTHDN